MKKTITIRIYKPTGEFLKTWDNASFSGFIKEINGGMGECLIDLGEKFDYDGGELQLGNTVEILVSDKQTNMDEWQVIYSGYISLYEPYADGQKEGIRVHVLGHYTKLSIDFLKSGSQTTLYTDAAAGVSTTSPSAITDVGIVMRGIIDRYRAETASPKLNYSLGSIPVVSQNLKYTFEQKTYREAMDVVKEAAPTGYYYYVDQFGTVWLKAKATEPKHTFILGKHFKSVNVERSIEKVRNVILIWNGETGGSKVYKEYKSDASINQYGRRAAGMNDYGIDDEASADNIGNKFIAENKDPDIKVTCEILDDNYYGDYNGLAAGYDIETIEPGDTCRFIGFAEEFSNIFKDNMMITKINYLVDRVELTIENVQSGIVDLTKRTDEKVNQEAVSGIPVTYT